MPGTKEPNGEKPPKGKKAKELGKLKPSSLQKEPRINAKKVGSLISVESGQGRDNRKSQGIWGLRISLEGEFGKEWSLIS